MPDDQTTDFPDDDEVCRIIEEAYKIAEAAYPKNEGQAYFEDLLTRATIGICRRGARKVSFPLVTIVMTAADGRQYRLNDQGLWEHADGN